VDSRDGGAAARDRAHRLRDGVPNGSGVLVSRRWRPQPSRIRTGSSAGSGRWTRCVRLPEPAPKLWNGVTAPRRQEASACLHPVGRWP
jgi:hypothetical protein